MFGIRSKRRRARAWQKHTLRATLALVTMYWPHITFAQPEKPFTLRNCITDAARGRIAIEKCHGRIAGACLDKISAAGGNLGNAAIYTCYTGELTDWLSLWAWSLQTNLW